MMSFGGRIWRVVQAADGTVQGEVMAAPRAMGTTNGIDLSPDGKRLYVSDQFRPDLVLCSWRGRIERCEIDQDV
ncbi:sugar lactone lactonase YvrE [Bradyrhizobium sp. USDA 4532]|nr:sugar lactone lactonase YvrE [Bradyrhizobium sp. USDA 4545]MCP1920075.1 sugar lactone lactonase YvrE [Bradyrhizobium sp. USDA 4532]